MILAIFGILGLVCFAGAAYTAGIVDEFTPARLYCKLGEPKEFPVTINAQKNTLEVEGRSFSLQQDLVRRTLQIGKAQGWEMDDGVLLSLELDLAAASSSIEDVPDSIEITGVPVVTTAEEMRKTLSSRSEMFKQRIRFSYIAIALLIVGGTLCGIASIGLGQQIFQVVGGTSVVVQSVASVANLIRHPLFRLI